jgi:hypothetical protein
MTDLLRELIAQTEDLAEPTVTASTFTEREWPPPNNTEAD